MITSNGAPPDTVEVPESDAIAFLRDTQLRYERQNRVVSNPTGDKISFAFRTYRWRLLKRAPA